MIKSKYWVEVCVGFFVLIGVVCGSLLIFQISGVNDLTYSKDYYTVTAEFENVSGLKPRAAVVMAGVNIGRITDIKFDKSRFIAKVTMNIANEVNNIPDDTEAKILTAGLLGDKYISLTEGYGSKTFLKNGSVIELENTFSTFSIEDIISKFLGAKAMGAPAKPSVTEGK